MSKPVKAAALLCAACLSLLVLLAHAPAPRSADDGIQKAAQAPAPDGIKTNSHTLFPELDHLNITAISVSTPSSSFLFHCEDGKQISVNGQRADYDVFNTLLSQITELPVSSMPSFTVPDAPLLTLTVSTREGQYIARFYEDDTQEEALIVSASDGAPQYRSTDAWRVGMLMMTCEGTRIQDERGNETPAHF